LKQKIDNFIRNIILLRNIEGNLIFLQHHAEANNNDQFLLNLGKIYQAINSVNQELPRQVHQFLNSAQTKKPSSSIEENINLAITTTISTDLENQTMKEELLEILRSCSTTFSNEEFTNIFDNIRNNSEEFHKQIIALEDLCLVEY
jgi:6-pyruvoyl-tetrahydropterin synthase